MKFYASKKVIVVAISSILIGACANSSNTQKGAGIGAVIGAVAGKATGDNDKSRYVWGAALGAIAGGAIGAYMDKQEEALREDLAGTGVELVREGDELRLVMPGDLTFNTDSAAVDADFYPVLNDVGVVLKNYEKTRLSIEGHTDSVGSESYNQNLSIKRANAVAAYLTQMDIDVQRLRTIGMGETAPIANNDDATARAKNRRVELKIIPISDS